jgi:hypothetical protein
MLVGRLLLLMEGGWEGEDPFALLYNVYTGFAVLRRNFMPSHVRNTKRDYTLHNHGHRAAIFSFFLLKESISPLLTYTHPKQTLTLTQKSPCPFA